MLILDLTQKGIEIGLVMMKEKIYIKRSMNELKKIQEKMEKLQFHHQK